MRYIKYSLPVILLAIFFYSCDRCGKLDCVSSHYYGQFRIISTTDGRDLVFGPNRIYDKNQIRFYTLKNTDTTFLTYEPIKVFATGYDSVLNVYFFPKNDTAYMRLSNGDIDTLKVSYITYNSKCCGGITEIESFRLNNLVDLPGGYMTQEIDK